ncbi:MAG: hypothetical protein IKN09_04880 [Clostridia bacterium]|nr:hypothetical protein [Clostridia bacterium]
MRNNRQKSLIKAIISNSKPKDSRSNVPETYSIVLGTEIIKIPKIFPEYRSMEQYLQDDNDLVFVELDMANLEWLSCLATKVMKIGQDSRYPFFDSQLDSTNPGISGFRIINEDYECVHVQVRRLNDAHPQVFILDYFEDDGTDTGNIECILSITCDLSKSKLAEVDIINARKLTKSAAWDYAYRIGGLFRYLMIYLRPWQYDKSNKHCVVEPWFNLVAAKTA